ncbi:hypothetical protein C0J52_15743 [Blattella germanica]|nr:hypothetical protein C0J52_15743 [Blattella germanica]
MDYFGEIIALGIDSVLFGICCRFYIKQCNAIKGVQNAEVVELNSSLENRVHSQPNQRLPYVAIRGSVKAIGAPIISVNNPNITGTIQKLSVKEHVVARGSAGYWADQERVIQEVYNSVPFGVRRRGVQTTEEMLREGTYVTGIGEISTIDGSMKLQTPSDGSPFYLTVLPISSLIRKLEDQKRIYRLLTILFGGIGLLIFGIMTRHWWRERLSRIQQELVRRQLEATRKERRRRVRDTDVPETHLCVVCHHFPREVILLPCGHVCICEDCSEGIREECPVCRAKIERRAAAYIS